jgi:hypothetical protein
LPLACRRMTGRGSISINPDPGAPREFWRGSGGYRAATVCRRGHPQSSGLTKYPAGELGRCPDCGANVLVACPRCGFRIRGGNDSTVSPPGHELSPGYSPPNFCDGCGAPHPWAPRQARLCELENLLDEEDIDEADRLVVTDHLRRRQSLDPDEDLEQERRLWSAVKRRAPGLFAGSGKRILDTLIDHATRRALGMDG